MPDYKYQVGDVVVLKANGRRYTIYNLPASWNHNKYDLRPTPIPLYQTYVAYPHSEDEFELYTEGTMR